MGRVVASTMPAPSSQRTARWLALISTGSVTKLKKVVIAKSAMPIHSSVVTLPVEINASQRAVAWLERSGVVDVDTRPMAADALKWAAYTYVIAALGSLATLFYYISLANRR